MRRAVGVLLGAATLGAVGWCLAPILWQLLTSLKPEAELYLAPPAWFPAAPAAAHYRAVLADGRFVRSVLNSAIIAGGATRALTLGDLQYDSASLSNQQEADV